MSSLRKLEFLRRISQKILIEPVTGCWLWQGGCTEQGYGVMLGLDGRHTTAQRVCYEVLIGPIPKGCELDHDSAHGCRVRRCIHPLHVDPCSHQINMRRSGNAIKIRCAKGHPFTPENTYLHRGRRYCRICNRLSHSRRKQP